MCVFYWSLHGFQHVRSCHLQIETIFFVFFPSDLDLYCFSLTYHVSFCFLSAEYLKIFLFSWFSVMWFGEPIHVFLYIYSVYACCGLLFTCLFVFCLKYFRSFGKSLSQIFQKYLILSLLLFDSIADTLYQLLLTIYLKYTVLYSSHLSTDISLL